MQLRVLRLQQSILKSIVFCNLYCTDRIIFSTTLSVTFYMFFFMIVTYFGSFLFHILNCSSGFCILSISTLFLVFDNYYKICLDAGTGNGMVKSTLDSAGEPCTISNAVVAIIRGWTQPFNFKFSMFKICRILFLSFIGAHWSMSFCFMFSLAGRP